MQSQLSTVCRLALLLGLSIDSIIYEYSNILRDLKAAISILELTRRSKKIARRIQLLQVLRGSCIGPFTLYEWIFSRLQMNEISEVHEYIKCAIVSGEYSLLNEYSLLLLIIQSNLWDKDLNNSSKSDILKMMHHSSVPTSEILMYSTPSEMYELSVEIYSKFTNQNQLS